MHGVHTSNASHHGYGRERAYVARSTLPFFEGLPRHGRRGARHLCRGDGQTKPRSRDNFERVSSWRRRRSLGEESTPSYIWLSGRNGSGGSNASQVRGHGGGVRRVFSDMVNPNHQRPRGARSGVGIYRQGSRGRVRGALLNPGQVNRSLPSK